MKKSLVAVFLIPAAAGATLLLIPATRDMMLGHIGNEPVHEGRPLRYWLRALRSGDERGRENAAHALGQIGPASPEVLPALSHARLLD